MNIAMLAGGAATRNLDNFLLSILPPRKRATTRPPSPLCLGFRLRKHANHEKRLHGVGRAVRRDGAGKVLLRCRKGEEYLVGGHPNVGNGTVESRHGISMQSIAGYIHGNDSRPDSKSSSLLQSRGVNHAELGPG